MELRDMGGRLIETQAEVDSHDLPFKLIDGDGYFWKCDRIQPDGRCGDYENRPQLCRDFEPASDLLCVHFGGAEAGADPL